MRKFALTLLVLCGMVACVKADTRIDCRWDVDCNNDCILPLFTVNATTWGLEVYSTWHDIVWTCGDTAHCDIVVYDTVRSVEIGRTSNVGVDLSTGHLSGSPVVNISDDDFIEANYPSSGPIHYIEVEYLLYVNSGYVTSSTFFGYFTVQ